MKMLRRSIIEALLSRRLTAERAPKELADIARLIEAARASAEPQEIAGEAELVTAIAASVQEALGDVATKPPVKVRALQRARSPKVAAITATFVLGSAAAAAAATGSLPAPIQTAVAHELAHIGISLPKPHPQLQAGSTAQVTPRHLTATTIAKPAASANHEALVRLCDELQHRHGEGTGPAPLLSAAKDRHTTIDAYCRSLGVSSMTASPIPVSPVPSAEPGRTHPGRGGALASPARDVHPHPSLPARAGGRNVSGESVAPGKTHTKGPGSSVGRGTAPAIGVHATSSSKSRHSSAGAKAPEGSLALTPSRHRSETARTRRIRTATSPAALIPTVATTAGSTSTNGKASGEGASRNSHP